MPCCDTIQKSFVNVSTTVVPMTYNNPAVTVMYYDELTEKWYVAGIATQIKILPGVNVTIEHGGPQTGVVKIQGSNV